MPETLTCFKSVCGNGISETGEECDDGNLADSLLAYIKASNTNADDLFGKSVALSADGSTLVVTAPGESSKATGIGGDQADNSEENAGAVYVFTRDGTRWTQQAYIKASNTDGGAGFGSSIALSADGSTLAVSALGESSKSTGIGGNQTDSSDRDAGAVYVFTRTGTTWAQQEYIKASNTEGSDSFGSSVALSDDGATLAVGAFGESSEAIGIGGDQADNSEKNAGAVYVFTRDGTRWTQQAYIKASNTEGGDFFGSSIALSADGSTLAVGAIGESSKATGIGNNQADNSAVFAGAVYVFTRGGTRWTQQAYIKASNTEEGDFFGTSVALSAHGSTLAVGAFGESSEAIGIGGNQADNSAAFAGAVYVFTRSGTAWTQQEYIKASNPGADDFFGRSVALSAEGSTLAVGADGGAGAVYGFTRWGTKWTQQAYIKASNTDADDEFGFSVALSADGSSLAVGAFGESSKATGIGGNQVDNSAVFAGAVYLY